MANLKLAIIDTGFCPQHQLSSIFKSSTVFDATGELSNLKCDIDYLKYPRFHGEKVLDIINKQLKVKESIDLYLISVFDRRGKQNIKSWLNAIDYINEKKIDLIVSAVGLIVNSKELVPDLTGRAIWIVSAARISPGIKRDSIVYPQMKADSPNIILVGDYIDQFKTDYGLINNKFIKVFEKDGPEISENQNHLSGTSYSVAKFFTKYLNKCAGPYSLFQYKNCFNQHLKKISTEIIVFE